MNTFTKYTSLPVGQSWIQVDSDALGDRPILPEEAPLTSLMFSELVYHEKCEVSSSHDVKKMIIQTEPDKGKVVYFKKCDDTYPPILAQIEAASSASCRLSRGENAARVRPVVNEKGGVVGTASYEIPTFTSFSGESLSVGVMLRMGVIEELVARYVRMEDDMHPDQIGVAQDLGVVGLDYDMLWYGVITAQIKGPRVINNGFTAPLPEDAFPITDEDINRFPDIRDAQPCHWPTKVPNNLNIRKVFPNRAEFLNFANDPMYLPVKYFAFLREVLIDPEEHLLVMIPHFSRNTEGVEMIKKMKACIEARWELLVNVLTHNAGFRKYIVKNKTCIRDIIDHFAKYNNNIAMEGIQLDLDKMENRFQGIVRKCMVKDLTVVLFDLGCKIKGVKQGWKEFKLSYQAMIDICLSFKTSDCSFPDAFFTLECELSNLVLDQRERMTQWTEFCQNITQVLENYRGLVTKKHGPLAMSIIVDRSRRKSMTLEDGSLDREKCIARALYSMLSNEINNKKVIEVVAGVLKEYAPTGYNSVVGGLNPWTFTRKRGAEIEDLIKGLEFHPDKTALLISNFLNSGEWNQSGYVVGGSANVTLIIRLAEKLLEGFKNQITLQQLRKHDLVELCFALESGDWNLEKSAKTIKSLFQDALHKK